MRGAGGQGTTKRGGPEGSKEAVEAPKARRRRTKAIPRVGPDAKKCETHLLPIVTK
jgi:hypothetical protein